MSHEYRINLLILIYWFNLNLIYFLPHERKRATCVACWALRKIRLICVQKINHRYLGSHRCKSGWKSTLRSEGPPPNRAVRKGCYIGYAMSLRSEGPTPIVIVYRCRTYSAPFPISIHIDSPHGLPCQMSGLQPSSITSASEHIPIFCAICFRKTNHRYLGSHRCKSGWKSRLRPEGAWFAPSPGHRPGI